MLVKYLFPIIFLVVGGFSSTAKAIDFHALAKNLTNGTTVLLSDVIKNHNDLKKISGAPRRQHEALTVFERRIANNEQEFRHFLKNKYILNAVPDHIDLDWESSTLNIKAELPADIVRQRGGALVSNILKATFYVPPSKAREIKLFPQYVNMEIRFHLDTAGRIVVDSLLISYSGLDIYKE